MNRKERLKLTQTPEKGFIYADESFYLPSPQPKTFSKRKEEDLKPLRIVDGPFYKELFVKILISGFVLFPYLLLAFFYNKRSDVSSLKDGEHQFRVEPIRSRLYNIARIEFGTTVTVEEGLYRYGLWGFRTSNDPNVILNDCFAPGDCLAVAGAKGSIKVRFRRKMKICKIGLFHPTTGKRNSAIKDFEVWDGESGELLGRFSYGLTQGMYQYFKLEPVFTNQLVIKVLSNHGCLQYTTMYKLFVYGKLN